MNIKTYTMSDGITVCTNGERAKKVPTVEVCREQLIKLLEQAGGDKRHQCVRDFWRKRSAALGADDALDVAFAQACWNVLEPLWEELASEKPPAVPDEEDVFGSFGL